LVAARKLSLTESAKALGISQTSVRRLIQNGHLPILKIGGVIKILERDLEAYLQTEHVRMTPSSVPAQPARRAMPAYLAESKHFR